MNFKEHACRWCREEAFEVVVQGPDLLLDNPGKFQFVRCNNCGLFRQNPYLDWEELSNFYPETYSSYQPQASEISSHVKRWDKRYGLWKRVKLIHKHKPEGKWIDIGAGTGRILQEASLWEKWRLSGIEPVEHAAKYIQDRTGIEVFSGRLESFTGHADTYDIVTMWDVLEHLEDPIAGFSKVKEILVSGGIFVFSMPNMHSWDRRVFKQFWIGYDLPRHLHLFPEPVLLEILDAMGFSVLEKRCVAGSHGAFMLNLLFWNRKAKSGLLEKMLNLGPDSILPRIASFIPLWLLDQLKFGSNITYVVQKK